MTSDVTGSTAKTREIQSAFVDSTRWNDFVLRAGDVVTVTWAKTGTTWTQQIVWQLQRGAPEGGFPRDECPWVDFRFNPLEEIAAVRRMSGPRNLKTHLPLDAMVFSPSARYLYVGRDARDTVWSAYNHQSVLYDERFQSMVNTTPWASIAPVFQPTSDVRDYYLNWLETDELPGFGLSYTFWEHVRGWWAVRDLPNVLMVHFDNLKRDPEREIRRIAQFLEIEVFDDAWPRILEHSSFAYMRNTAMETAPDAAMAETLGGWFHSGTNGRWRDVLSAEEAARCDAVAAQRLAPECAHWLRTGELPD